MNSLKILSKAVIPDILDRESIFFKKLGHLDSGLRGNDDFLDVVKYDLIIKECICSRTQRY